MIDDASWEIKATAFELLSFSFKYPNVELAESLISGEWLAACEDLQQAGCFELPDGFAAADLALDGNGTRIAGSEELAQVLRIEATRLFVGAPNPLVSPYEGVWRAKDDGVQGLLFVNPHTMDVANYLKKCGLGNPEGKNEPLDHVATELEFLQYLCMLEAGMTLPLDGAVSGEELPGGSPAAAFAEFYEKHPLTWMLRFAAAVEEKTRLPFYRAAAQLFASVLA